MPSIAALLALGESRREAAIPDLITHLAQPDSGLRWAAAHALGQMPQPPYVALREALHDPDKWVRAAAARALGKAGEAVPVLIAALDDPESVVRVAAAEALGMLGDPASVPALQAHLQDSETAASSRGEPVTAAIQAALWQINGADRIQPPADDGIPAPDLTALGDDIHSSDEASTSDEAGYDPMQFLSGLMPDMGDDDLNLED